MKKTQYITNLPIFSQIRSINFTYNDINLGIINFIPHKDNSDVTIIGPKNHAKGIFKFSEKIAAGKENITTKTKYKESINPKTTIKIQENMPTRKSIKSKR